MTLSDDRERAGELFTVEIPPDEDPMKTLALMTIISEFGWDHTVEQLVTEQVLQDGLLESSEKHYGSTIYGVLASDILTEVRRSAHGTVYNTAGSEYGQHHPENRYLVKFSAGYLHLEDIPLSRRPSLNAGLQIRNKLQIRGLQGTVPIQLPFRLQTKSGSFRSGSYHGCETDHLTPGHVTKKLLGEFVTGMQWRERHLKGSLGRAAELLYLESGLLEKVSRQRTVPRDEAFVTLDQLYAEAASDGVARSTVRNLKKRIERIAVETLFPRIYYTGDPTVIFDGETRLQSGRMQLSSIAVSSLVKIADQYGQPSPAADFIRDYARGR